MDGKNLNRFKPVASITWRLSAATWMRRFAFMSKRLECALRELYQNRDDPTSTHIFFDMGGGNQLAFFDFPEKGPAPTVRGVGSMHHIALKARPDQFQAIVSGLDRGGISYSLHGSRESGSVYVRDPDNILVEITTGY
jgi:catechol 2,3-dioxygenase-like lactoylglutathione lyase family enzyme